MKKLSCQQGMTFIEIMVVIALIVIVTSVSFSVLMRSSDAQRDEVRLLNAKNIQVALESYYNAYGHYPMIPVNSTPIAGEGQNCRNLNAIQHLLQPYLRTLPTDPEADAQDQTDPMHYKYSVNANTEPQQYILTINVLKNSDGDNSDSPVLKDTIYATEAEKVSPNFCKCAQADTPFDVRVITDSYKRLCLGSIEEIAPVQNTGASHFPENYTRPIAPPPQLTPPP